MYKTLSRTKVRFTTTKGLLSVEQLWDLSTTQLNELVVSLEEAYSASKGKTYLRTKSKKDKTLKTMFDVALDILNTKLDEQEDAATKADTSKEEQRILSLMKEKKEEDDKKLSYEELEAKLKNLKK